MLPVFLLQNQHDQYLGKSGEWLSGTDSKTLFRTQHKDEAINQKVEVAVKQADARIQIIPGFQLLNGQVVLGEDQPLPISSYTEETTPTEGEYDEPNHCQTAEEANITDSVSSDYSSETNNEAFTLSTTEAQQVTEELDFNSSEEQTNDTDTIQSA